VMGLFAFENVFKWMEINFFTKIFSGGIQTRLEYLVKFVFNLPECL